MISFNISLSLYVALRFMQFYMSRACEACQNLTFRKGTEVATAVSEYQAYLTALDR